MHPRTLVSGAILLLWSTTSSSATLTLAWEFPKTSSVPPWRLTVAGTTQRQTTQTQIVLTALDEATCQQLTGATYQADQTWCATLPCPAPGAYNVLLQADQSLPSNVLGFGVDDACHLTTYDAALQAQQPPPPAVQSSPVDMATTPVPANTKPPTKTVSVADTTPMATTPEPTDSAPAATALPSLQPMAQPAITTPPTQDAQPTTPPAEDAGTPSVMPASPEPPPPTVFQAPPPPPPSLSSQLQALQQQFMALEKTYRAKLDAITTAYEAALRQHHRPWHAYTEASRQQQEVYTKVHQQWTQLFAAYQQLLLKHQTAQQEKTTP